MLFSNTSVIASLGSNSSYFYSRLLFFPLALLAPAAAAAPPPLHWLSLENPTIRCWQIFTDFFLISLKIELLLLNFSWSITLAYTSICLSKSFIPSKNNWFDNYFKIFINIIISSSILNISHWQFHCDITFMHLLVQSISNYRLTLILNIW